VYLTHFGISEFPFGITPDTSFVYQGHAHQEALNTLLLAVKSGEGFIKVTGEVGTGKTLLCRRFIATLGEGYHVAYLPNPNLEPKTLLLAVAEELGSPLDVLADQYHLLKALNATLLQHASVGRSVVVCLDEAQAMPLETLEALRLLSNLETEKRKLMQVVMFGQPELDVRLANPSVRQLRQRIAFHYELGGLEREETRSYVEHRLRVAGHRGGDVFSNGAIRRLHRSSQGTPRLLNILAHKAMLSTFGEGKREVRARHVKAAARDTEGARKLWW